jgi:phosphoribosylanthranilate isomerase
MSEALQIKICGLTCPTDVARVVELGADYCGFIVYAPSPRGISFEKAKELAVHAPAGGRVLVDVEPSAESLRQYAAGDFDYFQLHTSTSVSEQLLKDWSSVVGVERLWLAPRLKPGEAFSEHFLPYAQTFLVDTYSANQVGGTGKTGDWGSFARWKAQYADKQWILAGGLNPENVVEALAQTGADHLDINSGVESEPGIKDHAKLKAVLMQIRVSQNRIL